MVLQTLGKLELSGSTFGRPKPLLLLAYLAIEGQKPRRFLAELFFMRTKDPLDGLSQALRHLRTAVGDDLQVDATVARTTIACDANAFLEAREKRDFAAAHRLYGGPFLADVPLKLEGELEEWVYGTREYLADVVRNCLTTMAEKESGRGEISRAAALAEQAYSVAGAGELAEDDMRRIHAWLQIAGNPRAHTLRLEAEELGIRLEDSLPEGTAEPKAISDRLPVSGSSFVGREQELREIAKQLDRPDCRLLTLHGIGGIGKSRLALQAARSQLDRYQFRDGIHFVALDTLASAELIPLAIAQELGIELKGLGDPLLQVTAAIGEQRMLLLLDNYEHLMDGAALPAELLRACRNLKIIVTSREILKLEEEWVKTLEGLRFPDGTMIEPAEALTFDAVRLFVQRAGRARVGFSPSREELPHLIDLCRLVEGAPLALELAAVWVRVLTLSEIVREITGGLALLRSRNRNAAERHASIEAVFEHSWRLLTAQEQAVMRRLALFVGGFERRGAAAVADATLPMLAGLVDKSLLRSTRNGRYGKHFLIQEFTKEKLRESKEEDSIRTKFARFHLDLLSDHSEAIKGPEQSTVLARFDDEIDNILAAWPDLFALDERERLPDAVVTLSDYLFIKGRGKEAIELLSTTLRLQGERIAGDVLVQATVEQCLAWLHGDVGDAAAARRFAEQSMARLDDTEYQRELAWSLRLLGNLCTREGEFALAEELFRRELAIYREAGDDRGIAPILNNLAFLYMVLGRYEEAEAHLLEGVALDRQHAGWSGLVSDLRNLGELRLLTGEAQKAHSAFGEGLEIAERLDYLAEIPYLLTGIGRALQMQGRCDAAERRLRRALEGARLAQDDRALIPILTALGAVLLEGGDIEQVEEYLARALALARDQGTTDDILFALIEIARSYLGWDRIDMAGRIARFVAASPQAWRSMRDDAEEIERACAESAPGSAARAAEPAPGAMLNEIVEEVLAGRR